MKKGSHFNMYHSPTARSSWMSSPTSCSGMRSTSFGEEGVDGVWNTWNVFLSHPSPCPCISFPLKLQILLCDGSKCGLSSGRRRGSILPLVRPTAVGCHPRPEV